MNSFYENQFAPMDLKDPGKHSMFRANDLYVMKSDMRYVSSITGEFTRFICEPSDSRDCWLDISFINAKHPEAFGNAKKRNDVGCEFVNNFLWEMTHANRI